MAADDFNHIEAAAGAWTRGDPALANLRLVFAKLPHIEARAYADRLALAEYLLDNGMAPVDLMKALALDPEDTSLGKYSPDQPRVPAGHGRESGRWTDDGTGPATEKPERPILVAENENRPGDDETEFRHATGHEEPNDEHPDLHELRPQLPPTFGIGPGPYAGRSVPAGPGARPTLKTQKEVTSNGYETGCHTCGTKDPGTANGRFYCDHQPPTALNSANEPQVYYPHCRSCSMRQGGYVSSIKRRSLGKCSQMKWIMSAGGPLILVEDLLRKQWGGTDSNCVSSGDRESDYDRACGPIDYLHMISLGVGSALILGAGPFDTSVWISPAGAVVVVQVECSEPDADIDGMLLSGSGRSKPISTIEFEFHSSNAVIFDSAYPGDEETEQLTFSLIPGRYRVSTEEVVEELGPHRGTSLVVHRFERI